jgi:hypothetical protein
MRDAADQSALAGAHLLQRIGNAILSHNRNVRFASMLPRGIEDPESARIGCCRYKDAMALRILFEKLAGRQTAWIP